LLRRDARMPRAQDALERLRKLRREIRNSCSTSRSRATAYRRAFG
jgi:ribosomal protein L19E